MMEQEGKFGFCTDKKLPKIIRKNYRFGADTDYDLRYLVEFTGMTETQVVEQAIRSFARAVTENQDLYRLIYRQS